MQNIKIIFASILILLCTQIKAQDIRLGILTDFPLLNNSEIIVKQLKEEIQKTVGQSREVKLTTDNIVSAENNWQITRHKYNDLSLKSDIIIVIGPVSTKAVISGGVLSVPTIAIGIIDQDLEDLPLTQSKTSGVKNFSYILNPRDFKNDVETLHELTKFKYLTILTDKVPDGIFNKTKLQERIEEIKKQYKANIDFVEVGQNIEADLARINPNTDAVAVFIVQPSAERIDEIAEVLIEKKLPSFSRSKWLVEHGLYCAKSLEDPVSQTLKKIAVMVDDVYQHQPLADMNVYLKSKEDLYININTAKKIGKYPDFKYLFTSNLITTADEDSIVYSLYEIINLALESNLTIKLSEKDYKLSEQDIKYARSHFFPTLDLEATGVLINEERAVLGQSEQTLEGISTLQQLLYSEEAIAGIRIQKYLRNAQEYAYKQEILSVLLDTYVAYFNILASKSILEIQLENLSISRRNLELAKVRVTLGSSNNSDIYRWESEVSIAEQSVVEANTSFNTAKLKLNTLLGNRLEEDFNIKDVKIDDDVYNFYRNGELSGLILNPVDLKILSDFLVSESVTSHPAKKQLLEQLNAVERQHTMNKRNFYTPIIAMRGQYSSVFYRGGKGAPDYDSSIIWDSNDDNWDVAISISFPLFDATRRKVKKQQSQIQLDQMEISRTNLDQNLELGIRSRLINLVGAITNIEFSRVASENAIKSFELVQDSYRQGMVSIVNLIDAQQATLNAKLGYDISVYDFLIAQIQLEYSIGSFSMLTQPEEKQDLIQRYLEFSLKKE